MLTIFKKIFTWWNVDTFGTRLKTILFGKFAGSDSFGNKYYESKNGKRWVIYADEIDASKIPVEWYSWMHFTPYKIITSLCVCNLSKKNIYYKINKQFNQISSFYIFFVQHYLYLYLDNMHFQYL